jgi:hypothetical protein
MDSKEMGRLGGKARAKGMTRAERKAAALVAINARWKQYRADKKRIARKPRKAA